MRVDIEWHIDNSKDDASRSHVDALDLVVKGGGSDHEFELLNSEQTAGTAT